MYFVSSSEPKQFSKLSHFVSLPKNGCQSESGRKPSLFLTRKPVLCPVAWVHLGDLACKPACRVAAQAEGRGAPQLLVLEINETLSSAAAPWGLSLPTLDLSVVL